MESHALQYSKGYRAKKGYTYWENDFDGMAYKTMLRQLLSKWGIMSIEMQKAFEADMSIVEEDGSYDYVDNEPEPVTERVANKLAKPEVIEAEVVEEKNVEDLFFENASF